MKPVKAILVGYGAMGARLRERAPSRGIEILAIVDPVSKDADYASLADAPLGAADVVIDFTSPQAVLDNVKLYGDAGVAVVMGTTGWYEHHDLVRSIASENKQRFLWASNFSIGVNLFFRLSEVAAKWFNAFDEYDVWGYEVHHSKKADSPSGTAQTLAESLVANLDRKQRVVFDKVDRRISPEELHFASVRGGSSNFEHTVAFDSEADCVTIRHAARNREGYVDGALRAARWIVEQEPGYYSLDDFISTLLGGS